MYDIRLAKGAEQDLKRLSAFHRNTIIDAIERSLANEPARVSRNRKILMGLIPPWTAEPPIWELRVGDYRVFYDVAAEERVVYIRHSEEAIWTNNGRHPMKKATVQDLRRHTDKFVTQAQNDRVVITRQGKPAAVLVGVSKQDWESVVLQTDPKFWKLIHARRKQSTRSLSQVKAGLRRRK